MTAAAWIPVETPPALDVMRFDAWPTSAPVLIYRPDGREISIATLERLFDDEPPRWISCDSARWTLRADSITHWQPLPEPPQ